MFKRILKAEKSCASHAIAERFNDGNSEQRGTKTAHTSIDTKETDGSLHLIALSISKVCTGGGRVGKGTMFLCRGEDIDFSMANNPKQ